MKTIRMILALLALPILSLAQTALTATTTNATMNSTQNFVVLSSTTGIADKSQLYIQDIGQKLGELVTVRGACSSTQCTIVRNGSNATAGGNLARTTQTGHISGAMVLISPLFANNTTFGQWAQAYSPLGAAPIVNGTAACSNSLYTPWLNAATGDQWFCSTQTNTWVPGWGTSTDSSAQVITGTATASVAGATAIAAPLVHISGTNAITSFTMSVGWNGEGFCVIPDGAFTTTATNNILKASTAVANRPLCFTWDAKNAGFVPSY